MNSASQSSGHPKTLRGVRARIAHLFRRSRRRAVLHDETEAPVRHLSHQAPDPVEWDESLIGIEPNSGELDPPTIC
jgi:hypothetical protein